MSICRINAKKLFNHNRLDLVVRYLYGREILEKDLNDYSKDVYKDLYTRMVLLRTMGTEPHKEGEATVKKSINDYYSSFYKLIKDIKINGYNESFPVKITLDGLLSDGAHRVSAAALFNKEIAITEVAKGSKYDFNWFCTNGFNTEDKQRILKGFVDINSNNCAIFVVWHPLLKYLDNIKAVIKKYFDIAGDLELDFEDNYIAFRNILLEIYEPNISKNNNETTILEKAKILEADYLSFQVIVAVNQKNNRDVSELSKCCKNEIRDLFEHILPKTCFCTVHSSDSVEECIYLSNILLSPNNIKHLLLRNKYEIDSRFIKRVRGVKYYLQGLNINSSNDICVMRSGVMAALGILDDCDLDFIISSRYKEKAKQSLLLKNPDYDILMSDWQNFRRKIFDDCLITNSEYHFYFKGIKFANLEIVKDRKKEFKKNNDSYHYRLICLFEKLSGHINQQKILMKRIEEEQKRRQMTTEKNAQFYSNFFERLFSVKNKVSKHQKYKVITICGLKINYKCSSDSV